MSSFILKNKSPLTLLLVLVIMGGMFAYTKMQTSLFPEITFPKIKVIADAGHFEVIAPWSAAWKEVLAAIVDRLK